MQRGTNLISNKRLTIVVAALTALFLIGVGAASAQLRGDFHESGVIAAMTRTNITVNNLVYDVVDAVLDDEGSLGIGVLVDIDYLVTAEGRAVAIEVEIDDAGDENGGDDDTDDEDLHAAGVVTAMTTIERTVQRVK